MPTAKEQLDKVLVSLENVVKTLDAGRPTPMRNKLPPGTVTSDEKLIVELLADSLSKVYAGDAATTQNNTLTMYLGFAPDDTLKKGDRISYGNAVHATITDVTFKEHGQGGYLVNVVLGKNPVGPLLNTN